MPDEPIATYVLTLYGPAHNKKEAQEQLEGTFEEILNDIANVLYEEYRVEIIEWDEEG
jgi:hypothetical protein